MNLSSNQQKYEKTLDSAQLVRIEAVHRGFLFQHLYAVQCLLSAATLSIKSIEIENDEDVEVHFEGRHIYVQIKHRKESLAWNDIEDAVTRFNELRTLHKEGKREKEPAFIILSNSTPNGPLATKIAASSWPIDIQVDWPGAVLKARLLPPPQASLLETVEMATQMARNLPFATLTPETLVWKLAGLVSLAATGEDKKLDHIFQAEELPQLFEQFVIQLQDLPLPPSPYRVQEQEPELLTGNKVRLIVGYSGAGKTSWLAQSAQHSPGPLVYLDTSDIPGSTLANAIAREVAGRMFNTGQNLGEIFLPGASGNEMLQLLSRHIAKSEKSVTVALDNIQKLSADSLIRVIQSGKDINFILLGRPEGEVSNIEALLGISREALKGWSPDTVATIAHEEGCKADAADCQQLINLTGGLPLFVLNAVLITKSDYDGSLKKFCADLALSTHTKETAQDFILGQIFDHLPKEVANVAELLSLCDVPITRDEIRSYILSRGEITPAILENSLRNLVRQGLLQIYSNDRIKLHDAACVIGRGRLQLKGGKSLQSYQLALRAVIEKSLHNRWHSSKLALFLRLTGEVGRLDVLVEIATEELFHEMGIWSEIETYLVQGAEDKSVNPEQRIKALDGLAFYDLKTGSDRATKWLGQMDALITEHGLGEEEQLRVGMKRMNLLAKHGDQHGAKLLISKLTSIIKNLSIEHQRVFEYNAACAELALGDAEAAAKRVAPLIKAYYELIGLSPGIMMGNNAPALARMLKKNTSIDDIKHLADALDVLAKTHDAQGQFSPFARIHALKLYDLVRAPDSLFRVGQDLVDQFIAKHDFDGALNIMETNILPLLQQWKLADYMITVRSHYAVVLAYCKRYSDAEAEMARLAPYEDALPPRIQQELRSQRKLIAEIKRDGPPPKWEPPLGLLENIARHFADKKIMKPPARPGRQKIGRNEKCPCGSGKKFKHCHGN